MLILSDKHWVSVYISRMQSIEKVMHFVKEILAGIVTVGISRYLELKWSFTN